MKDKKTNFIYTLKLDANNQDIEQLEKRFRIAQDIYKHTLWEIGKRIRKMKKDPLYKKAINMPKKTNKEKKERNEVFNELRKKYDLVGKFTFTKFANDYRNQRHYNNYIPSDVAIKLGERAWNAQSKVMFAQGAKRVNFKRLLTSFEGKGDSGVYIRNNHLIISTSDKTKRLTIPIIYEGDSIEEEILRNNLKFCRVLKRFENKKWNYYVQMTFEGEPVIKTKPSLNTTVGIDIGLTSVALSSYYQTELLELAPEVDTYEKEIRLLQRKMDRQRRANNPNNFNADGTIKKGKKIWRDSKAYLKTKATYNELSRLQSERRKHAHRAMTNKLIEMGNHFVIEQMSFSELAKRHEEQTNSKITGKLLSKAGFGKHIKRRSPAAFVEMLRYKTEFRNGSFIKVSPEKIMASEINHQTKETTFIPLNQRAKVIGDSPVQRDLYAAFILQHVNEDGETIDFDACQKEFDTFLRNQELTMNNLEHETPSMGVKQFNRRQLPPLIPNQ